MTNPNARILQIPREYGADETDSYYGSIGDATQKHLAALSNTDRLLWEKVILTKDGNIFRVIPSTDHNVPDTLSLRGKELDEFAEKFDLNIEWIKEDFASERERRETSEDALDRGELIPYDNHERFPGMTKHIDIPSTPRDRFIYLGNCNQDYYDAFPEGHPNSLLINMTLRMLDKDIDEIDKKYAKWICKKIEEYESKQYVRQILCDLVYEISTSSVSPSWTQEEATIKALNKIDKCWRIEYKNEAADQLLKDPMFVLFLKKEKEWDLAYQKGVNVFPQVKSMGKILHDNFRKKMRKVHWERYRSLKKKFAPKVMYKGKDLNRCRLQDIKEVLGVDRTNASKIWTSRPFTTFAELYSNGFINKTSFSTSENLEKATEYIESKIKEALASKSKSKMSRVASTLVDVQRTNPDKLSHDEWKTLWVYYRLCRDEFNKEINKK